MAWNIEWLNQNSGRAYPFKEDSLRKDITGGVTIPNSLITDLCLVVPADYDSLFYLSQLTYSGTTVSLILSVAGGSDVATVAVNMSTHSTNDAYAVTGTGAMSDIRGRICIGDLSGLDSLLPQGTYSFTSDNTLFEARAVRPDLRGVRSLVIVKADGTVGESLSGTVELVEGGNIRLTYVPATYSTSAGIRIDSMATDLESDCECSSQQTVPRPIRSINGVTADNAGNIVLEPLEDCLDISAGTNAVKFSDKCSKPCCGCSELNFLTEKLSQLQTSIENLQSRADQVQGAQTNFHNNVLGSLAGGT